MTTPTWRNLWQHLLPWLTRNQEKASSDDDLINLPDTLQAELAQSIQSLPSPQAYQTAIQAAIGTGIQTWQQNLEATNSLIILGNPVEPIAKILQDSLQTWPDAPDVQVITPFPDLSRPHDPLTIAQQIQQALEPYSQINVTDTAQDAHDALDAKGLEQRTTVIVIPALEQCFLRCIGGWDGIEALRDMTIHNPHCFWVMGCNYWAWEFLDFVCQISAYFSEIHPLPKLDGAALQDWLDPIATLVVENDPQTRRLEAKSNQAKSIDNASVPKKGNTLTENERRQAYWSGLAERSSGVSEIAVNLWLQGLRIRPDALADDPLPSLDLDSASSDGQPLTLYETSPTLPSLPSLTNRDRYLLHSTLIHGRITRVHLALSLGESESPIQARIQWLLRQGVLERSNGVLSVCPSYYKKLQSELANNNFFVGGD
jgi:Transcriptional regulators